MLLEHITVILVRPKYSENVGAVARACANMGCPHVTLVSPRGYSFERALRLATPKGRPVLEDMRQENTLASALADFNKVYAATARTGRWRKGLLLPDQAARRIWSDKDLGLRVALVFGPEDKGLTNEEIEISGRIISIPTTEASWSLNLAQAVLIILYECFKNGPKAGKKFLALEEGRCITHKELVFLYATIREVLLEISFINRDNSDYFMMPLKRFMNRFTLRHNEYNLLMGICRQIRWIASRGREK